MECRFFFSAVPVCVCTSLALCLSLSLYMYVYVHIYVYTYTHGIGASVEVGRLLRQLELSVYLVGPIGSGAGLPQAVELDENSSGRP